jgi:hypothetical protein
MWDQSGKLRKKFKPVQFFLRTGRSIFIAGFQASGVRLNIGVSEQIGRASARRRQVLAKTGAHRIDHRVLQNRVGTEANRSDSRCS